jgi:hypothetical protein
MKLADLDRAARRWRYVLACAVDQRDAIQLVTPGGRPVALLSGWLVASSPASDAGALFSYIAHADDCRESRRTAARAR